MRCMSPPSPATCYQSPTKSKATRTTFPPRPSRPQHPGDVLSVDLFGPMEAPTAQGHRYGLVLVDGATRYLKLYTLRTKAEAVSYIKRFVTETRAQHDRRIKVLRSDNGTEFVNRELEAFLEEEGIVRDLSAPHTPEQNGQAERYVRVIKEGARTLLVQAGLGPSFWAAAAKAFVFARNRTAVKGEIPLERWTGRRVTVKDLRVFGCVAFAHVPRAERKAMDPVAIKGIFVGYVQEGDGAKAWLVYVPSLRRTIRSASVAFQEELFWNDRESAQEATVDVLDTSGVVVAAEQDQDEEEEDEDSPSDLPPTPHVAPQVDEEPDGPANLPVARRRGYAYVPGMRPRTHAPTR